MGVTGEVHRKKAHKIENAFGQLVKNEKDKTFDDDLDGYSERSFSSAAGFGQSRRTSLQSYQQSSLSQKGGMIQRAHTFTNAATAFTRMATKNTKLEQILEDNPQAENEMTSSFLQDPILPVRRKNSLSHIKDQYGSSDKIQSPTKGKINLEDHSSAKAQVEESQGLYQEGLGTPREQGETPPITSPQPMENKPDLNLQVHKHQTQDEASSKKRKLAFELDDQQKNRASPQGNILDLVSNRINDKRMNNK